jgi:hypothetical protein
MKPMHGAAAVVASFLAMMLLAPPQAANARAGGARGFHFAAHHHSARHLARHRFPLYSGYLLLPPYDASTTYAPPQPFVFVSEPRRCRYDRQVVTVASEQGGTRQITVTRC